MILIAILESDLNICMSVYCKYMIGRPRQCLSLESHVHACTLYVIHAVFNSVIVNFHNNKLLSDLLLQT